MKLWCALLALLPLACGVTNPEPARAPTKAVDTCSTKSIPPCYRDDPPPRPPK